LYLICIWL